MRHNQNVRRGARNRGNGHHHGGGHHGGGHHGGGSRRINPRVHSFDSNGPDVRIRGTAYQIHEKYVGLARDASAAGDRVLAESYLQHAEHYQRFINEASEEFNQYQQLQQQQPVLSADAVLPGEGEANLPPGSGEQPSVDGSAAPDGAGGRHTHPRGHRSHRNPRAAGGENEPA